MNDKNNPVNVGLAAYGMSGRVFHGPLIDAHPGFVLKKVVERSGSGNAQKRYPHIETVRSLEELLEDKDIELVVVNTPEHTHYELGKQAIMAGKHVVIEKAFTITSQEARELIRLAEEQKVMLSVFQNARWHGDFITIQKIINQKLLGQLVSFEAHYDRYRNFIQADTWKEEKKRGTGSLYNLGPHLIDQALVLFGSPHAVYADLQIQREGGKVIDYFELMLYYKGLKVTLKSSYLVREPGPRYILHGNEGSFIKYGGDTQEAHLKSGGSPLAENYGQEPESFWGTLNTQLKDLHVKGRIETEKGSYLGYYDNIYSVIREKSELIVKPQQALQTIEIIEAAIQSNEEGRVVFLKTSF
jgi:predicted dehydrogenase